MRCYNGCPDKKLQEMLDERSSAIAEADKAGVHLAYFPAEEAWMAFREYRSVSDFHSTPRAAFQAASA